MDLPFLKVVSIPKTTESAISLVSAKFAKRLNSDQSWTDGLWSGDDEHDSLPWMQQPLDIDHWDVTVVRSDLIWGRLWNCLSREDATFRLETRPGLIAFRVAMGSCSMQEGYKPLDAAAWTGHPEAGETEL